MDLTGLKLAIFIHLKLFHLYLQIREISSIKGLKNPQNSGNLAVFSLFSSGLYLLLQVKTMPNLILMKINTFFSHKYNCFHGGLVNRGEWLWNSTNFFVAGLCSLFWPWPRTKHNSCSLRTEDLTNRNVLVT